MIKPNDPAFPVVSEHALAFEVSFRGLTKRELFAAMAMQGFCSNPEFQTASLQSADEHDMRITDWIAVAACEHADSLLQQLEESSRD